MTYDDDEVERILVVIETGHRATDLLLDAMKAAAKIAESGMYRCGTYEGARGDESYYRPCGTCIVCAAQKVVAARMD
jgi:hypothetical protein